MKRLRRPAVESILKHTTLPSPPLFNQSLQKNIFLTEAARSSASTPNKNQYHFWRLGRGVLNFAMWGLLLLIGGGTIIAQASRSQPGGVLYGLNRALERTQLALTQDEVVKLELKLDFAEERLDEAISLEGVDSPIASEVIPDTRVAIREIDNQFDKIRVALSLDQPAKLSREDLSQLEGEFKQLLARYEEKLVEMRETVSDPASKEALADIDDILAAELNDARDLSVGGFYVEIEGGLSEDGTGFTFDGQRLELTGLPGSNPLAGGRVELVRVMGELIGAELRVDQVMQKPYRLLIEDGQVIFMAQGAVLQQDADGLFVDNGSKRFNLSGGLISDERLIDLVDQPVEIEGLWQDGPDIVITGVTAETPQGRVQLPDVLNPNPAQTETGEALPAEDIIRSDTPAPTPETH